MAKKRGMSRRDFFRLSMLGGSAVFAGGFAAASLGMLWPSLRGGFGAKINLGKADDLKAELASIPHGWKYYAEARTYLVLYKAVPGKEAFYKGVADGGLLAVYQKCAHLGCKVPQCESSGWFECPCHGSRYNKAGEYEFGPAPTGLQHFPIVIDGGNVVVDTADAKPGPPRGTDTINQNPEGAHCTG
ncbi:MAG: cytochrome b6-f complex iron-sulfur subunit [Frankiaceae bacterium]|nr:cytochrome b6-f complex iron-sulfur subunit [Frankiaceae bacterium]